MAAPAAERRLVTVLFADAAGSTALTERIGDEEAYRLVQGCVARMTDAVERHGGTVSQFRGDGIMALFGAPQATEDAAVQAVTAALEMQASLEVHAREVEARLGEACAFRVGINTGPVVVGRLGDDLLVDYTAIGDTANVAARMEQAAAPGAVFLSESTWRAVRDFVECVPAGDLTVKGKGQPVPAWQAVSRRHVRSRLDAAMARGLSTFVGRDHELRSLKTLVERAQEGQGAVVLVIGEAGIGKSRLLWELRSRLHDGVDWFEGRASAHGQQTPWLAIADLLRSVFAISEDDTPADIAAAIDTRSQRWSPEARSAVPYMKWLLHAGEHELDDLDPRERRAGAHEALCAVLLDGARRRPIVVAVEDLHWADDASREAVETMGRALAGAPVLLVVTSRPGRLTGIDSLPWCTRLPIGELSRQASTALAADVLASDLPQALHELVSTRAEGNPLFVEELVASLVEQRIIDRRDGVATLTVDPATIEVPGSLQEVVLARVDRLHPEARDALQLASVIGREFTRRLLDRVVATERLDGHLAELESLELVRRTRAHPEVAYLFKHAVVHEVTYSTLLAERRRQLHRIVAEAIEDLYRGRLHEHAEALARHWLEAGEPARALEHLERAGERALAGFATAEADAAYSRAAAIATELGDRRRAMSLWGRRIHVCQLTTDLGAWIVAANDMADLARAGGDEEAEARALSHRAVAELWLHDFDRAEATARRARQMAAAAAAAGAVDAFLVATAQLRITLAIRGHLAEVARLADEGAPLLGAASPSALAQWHQTDRLVVNWRADWRPPPGDSWFDDLHAGERLLCQWTEGLVAAGKGDYVRALELLHVCVEDGERLGEVLVRGRALNSLGWIHLDLGDVAGATGWNAESLAVVEPVNAPDPEVASNARLNLADCHLATGDLAGAARELAIVERVVRQPSGPEEWMLWRYSQHFFATSSRLALASGDHAAAARFSAECLDLAETTGSRKYVAIAHRLAGEAEGAAGHATSAADRLRAAHDLAVELGNPPERWRTAASLADHCVSCGQEHDARGLAAEALASLDRVAAELGDHALAHTVEASPLAGRLRRLAAV